MEAFNAAVTATKEQVKSLTAPPAPHHLLADEKNEAVWPKYLIKETSPSKQQWDLAIMLCIVYSALVVPFRIGFHAEADGWLWDFEASMSLIFMADLVLSFNTAYLLEGNWVTSKQDIAKRYLSGWFWIDAPSSVPVELIELTEKYVMHTTGGNSSMLSAFRILRMLRLVRILRLLKFGEYISRIEEQLDMSLRGLKIVQLMLEIVFIAHLLACAWFSTTWLHGMHNLGEATWIDVYEGGDAADGPPSQQYLYSFYWALTVLSAQNPIPPTTDSERVFMVGVSLLNRLLFAYIVGKISALITALDRQSALVTDKLDVIKEYLYWRSTPRELAIRIKRYYEFYYQKQAVFDENAILNGLSPSLHSELVTSICKDTLGKIPLFAKLSPEFQAQIFPLLKPLSFNRGDVIYASGSASDDLLFLLDGSVDMLSEVDGTTPARRIFLGEEVLLSSDGEELVRVDGVGCFGQEVFVGMRRRSTAVARTGVELLNIEKGDLIKLFKQGIGSDLRRVCTVLLDAFVARERLRYFGSMLRISFERSPEVKAGLLIQLQWRRFCESEAQETNELYKLISNQRARSKSIMMMPRRSSIGERSRSSLSGPSGLSGPLLGDTDGVLAAIGKLAAQNEAMKAIVQLSMDKLAAQQDAMQAKQDAMQASLKSLMEKSGSTQSQTVEQSASGHTWL